MNNFLYSRTMSGFPLSIATGLAMESLFNTTMDVADPARVHPGRISLQNYAELWVNVTTLIRNAFNACARELQPSIKIEMMVDIITQEISTIKELLAIEGNGICQPVFYWSNPTKIFPSNIQHFKLRDSDTFKHRHYKLIEEKTMLTLVGQIPELRRFDLTLNGGGKTAIILTHTPTDLLSYRYFRNLDLLESHTGKLKTRLQWNTKYYEVPGEDMGRFPFCRHLLSVFGDSVTIAPMKIGCRKSVCQALKDAKINPASSPQAVSDSFGRMPDQPLASHIRTLPLF